MVSHMLGAQVGVPNAGSKPAGQDDGLFYPPKVRRTILDCDGVLADWTGAILAKLNVGLTVDDCYDFSLRNVLKNLRGKEIAKRADAIASRSEFTASQPVLAWAKELLELCLEAGDVLIVTSPWASRGWYDARVEWLKGMGLHQDNVMVGRMKSWVSADLFVDDKPKNVIEWATDPKRHPGERAVLLAWPYNKDHDELPPNARRMTAQELIAELRVGFPPWVKAEDIDREKELRYIAARANAGDFDDE